MGSNSGSSGTFFLFFLSFFLPFCFVLGFGFFWQMEDVYRHR